MSCQSAGIRLFLRQLHAILLQSASACIIISEMKSEKAFNQILSESVSLLIRYFQRENPGLKD